MGGLVSRLVEHLILVLGIPDHLLSSGPGGYLGEKARRIVAVEAASYLLFFVDVPSPADALARLQLLPVGAMLRVEKPAVARRGKGRTA